MLLLTTLAYPGGVAGDVSEAQLAGAVVGTFLATLLLCAVLAAAGYWYFVRKRQNYEPCKQQRYDVETPPTSPSECCICLLITKPTRLSTDLNLIKLFVVL